MIRMLRPIALIFAAVLAFGPLTAQVGSGTLKGEIMDLDASEPLPFASVVLFLNGNQVSGTNTDFDGKYTIKPVQPGTYDVLVSFVGYQSQKIMGGMCIETNILQ